MFKNLLFSFFSIILSLFWAKAQPSLSAYGVVYPCSDSRDLTAGGNTNFKEYKYDSVFYTITNSILNPRISHNEQNLLILDQDGQLYGMGKNSNGELGKGDTLKRNFIQVTTAPLFDTLIVSYYFAFGLSKQEAAIYYWGYKQATLFQDSSQIKKTRTTTPTRVFKDLDGFKKISLGQDFVLLLKDDGKLFGYGINSYSQLGNDTVGRIATPSYLGLKGIRDISAGYNHSLVVDSSGAIYAFGANPVGECGIDPNGEYIIKRPRLITSGDFVSVTAGKNISFALTSDGEVYSWGLGAFGSLGNGSNNSNFQPQKIDIAEKITAVYTKDYYVIAHSDNDNYFAWGLDYNGVFGLNKTGFKQFSPVKLNTSCTTSGVSEEETKKLSVYPNPSISGVFLMDKAVKWQVLSPNGQEIHKGISNKIDLSKYSSGLYFLQLENGEIQKIVKE